MNILIGIRNFLEIINNNWTVIIVIVGLGVALYKKIVNYIKTSDEEKIEIAKKQIKEIILRLISDAEDDYSEWVLAGSIKRSQVIDELYLKYPILSKFSNQDELIEWIDKEIDNALDTLREVIKQNTIDDVSKDTESK